MSDKRAEEAAREIVKVFPVYVCSNYTQKRAVERVAAIIREKYAAREQAVAELVKAAERALAYLTGPTGYRAGIAKMLQQAIAAAKEQK